MEQKKRNVSAAEEKKMIELWMSGMTGADISKRVGRSKRVVEEHIRKAKKEGKIPANYVRVVKRKKRTTSFKEMKHTVNNPPEKPDGIVVKCTASVAKKCVYGIQYQVDGMKCHYILCEGHMRGCPPEACTHFAKATRENGRRRPVV